MSKRKFRARKRGVLFELGSKLAPESTSLAPLRQEKTSIRKELKWEKYQVQKLQATFDHVAEMPSIIREPKRYYEPTL